jgi:hypothetical protein
LSEQTTKCFGRKDATEKMRTDFCLLYSCSGQNAGLKECKRRSGKRRFIRTRIQLDIGLIDQVLPSTSIRQLCVRVGHSTNRTGNGRRSRTPPPQNELRMPTSVVRDPIGHRPPSRSTIPEPGVCPCLDNVGRQACGRNIVFGGAIDPRIFASCGQARARRPAAGCSGAVAPIPQKTWVASANPSSWDGHVTDSPYQRLQACLPTDFRAGPAKRFN